MGHRKRQISARARLPASRRLIPIETRPRNRPQNYHSDSRTSRLRTGFQQRGIEV